MLHACTKMHNPPNDRITVITVHIVFSGKSELAARWMPLVISTNPKISGLPCAGSKLIKGDSPKIEINDENKIKVPPNFSIVNDASDIASVIANESFLSSKE